MALISYASFLVRRRRAALAAALCATLAACDMQQDDRALSGGEAADAASAVEAPEPASGWRFVRIAAAADAGASMSARVEEDPRLAQRRRAVVGASGGVALSAASSASSASSVSSV
ncbi:TPA: cytochrome c, partial [Burkholderia vietnamiensis]|nr:cytochrome c [Burkholderia vietnamiensis]